MLNQVHDNLSLFATWHNIPFVLIFKSFYSEIESNWVKEIWTSSIIVLHYIEYRKMQNEFNINLHSTMFCYTFFHPRITRLVFFFVNDYFWFLYNDFVSKAVSSSVLWRNEKCKPTNYLHRRQVIYNFCGYYNIVFLQGVS